jgi:hypothetical protein
MGVKTVNCSATDLLELRYRLASAMELLVKSRHMANPTNPVIQALQDAIEAKKKELAELEAAMSMYQRESLAGKQKRLRFRAKTGFKQGSIPDLVNKILKESPQPLSAAELAEALKAKGKAVESKMIAASIARYIDEFFRRNEEGKYLLVAAKD